MPRRSQKQAPQTLIVTNKRGENDEEEEEGEKGGKFFACYLLTSVCPRFKGHTYIGFTVNPRRRIRQHNGEIGCGAWRTKRKRPWEMVLCIYGFPTNIVALQFEWAWQHPVESLAVRKAAVNFKSISGLANKIKLAYTMLTLPAWKSLNLTVNLFSTKYQKYMSGCPTLPEQMRTQVCSMDELPCYNTDNGVNDEDDDYNDKEEFGDINGTFQGSPDKEPTEEVGPSSLHEIEHDVVAESRGYSAETNAAGEDHTFIIDSCLRTPSSFRSSYIAKDREQNHPSLIEDLTLENEQPLTTQSAASSFVADEVPPAIKIPVDVEVIDLFTPSPSSVINSCDKNRRKKITKCPFKDDDYNDEEECGTNRTFQGSPNKEPTQEVGPSIHCGSAKSSHQGIDHRHDVVVDSRACSAGEDQTFIIDDSCLRTSASSCSSYIFEGQEQNRPSSIENLTLEHEQPLTTQSAATIFVAEEDLPSIESPVDVEIIEIFTPSPCYAMTCSKNRKRKVVTRCPEVIDLTNSPMFV